jgi:hypothetical protein
MASVALHHGVTAVPVVDARGRLVRVVSSATLIARPSPSHMRSRTLFAADSGLA